MNLAEAGERANIACKDCLWLQPSTVVPGLHFCWAPQLKEHLHDDCDCTHSDAVRDINALCGLAARWFEPNSYFVAKSGQAAVAQERQPASLPEQREGT